MKLQQQQQKQIGDCGTKKYMKLRDLTGNLNIPEESLRETAGN